MPVVMEMERSPGVPCSVSPSEAPWAVRRVAPPKTVAGRVLRRVVVATGVAVTWTVGRGAGGRVSPRGVLRALLSAAWEKAGAGATARAPRIRVI
jgi:hypothetical protein